jgi:DNA-binding XRE family transcriptional regulator
MYAKSLIISTMFWFLSPNSIVKLNTADISNNIEKTDYVPNKETAIKIAEAIWLPIYGNNIYRKKPFVAKLRADNVWIVEGTLKEQKGGVPYIEIRKNDCKILKVTHGK